MHCTSSTEEPRRQKPQISLSWIFFVRGTADFAHTCFLRRQKLLFWSVGRLRGSRHTPSRPPFLSMKTGSRSHALAFRFFANLKLDFIHVPAACFGFFVQETGILIRHFPCMLKGMRRRTSELLMIANITQSKCLYSARYSIHLPTLLPPCMRALMPFGNPSNPFFLISIVHQKKKSFAWGHTHEAGTVTCRKRAIASAYTA